jgi:WD40 repeat protein
MLIINREPSSIPALYKGLEPFAENDSGLLFARRDERDRLVYSLQSVRLTVLYGAKQVGKTSLLRAGVANRLRQKSQKSSPPGPPDSCVVVFDDWSAPDVVQNLSSAIDKELERIGAAREKMPEFQKQSFIQNCEAWAKCLGEGEGELFILFDQFDDYLMLNPRARTGRGCFDREFASAISKRGLPVNFLIAIRDDLLASLDRYHNTVAGLYSNLIRLEALTRKQAREAIQNPVYEYNSKLQDKKIGIEPELVRAVLDSVSLGSDEDAREGSEHQAAADQGVDAGGLQLAMKAVWEWEIGHGSQTLRQDTFNGKLGGLPTITTRYVDELFRTLSPRERRLSAKIFDNLITPGGLGVAHQLSDLAKRVGVTQAEIKALTEKLQTKKMIVASGVGKSIGSLRYEMAHRVLTPAVLERVRTYSAESEKEERLLAAEIERSSRLFDEKSQLDALKTIIKASENWSAGVKSLKVGKEWKVDIRKALQTTLNNLSQKGQLQGYQGAVCSIAYSRDGNFIATGAETGSVRFWNVRDPERRPLVCKNRHKTWIWALRVSLDGKWLATGSDDSTVALWTLSGEGFQFCRSVLDIGSSHLVRGLSFSPASSLLAIAATDGRVRVWDLEQEKVLYEFIASRHAVRCVEFSPGDRILATGADDGTISFWDLEGKPLSCGGFKHCAAVWGIRFHPDGDWLASCSEDHCIKVWNLKDGREAQTLIGHTSWVLGIQYNSDGSLLASASEDGTARLWDQEGNQTAIFMHGAPVNGVCFSPDDLTLATAAANCKVTLWNIQQKSEPSSPKRFRHPKKPILLDVSFASDGKLATGATDSEVQIWNEHGQVERTLKGHDSWIMCIVFHPLKSSFLATGSIDGTARLWNIDADTSTTFAPGDGPVWSVAFSPDGHFLATGSGGGMICHWDLHEPNEAPVERFPSDHGSVWTVRFSRDGKWITAGCQDGSILMREFPGGNVKQLTGVHDGQVLSLSFSPDGRFLASSSSEGRICVWDFAEKKHRWLDLDAPIWSVCFSPNGKLLASGSVDRSVRLWNPEGESLGTYRAEGPIRGLAFSRDGRWLAASCSDATVRLWPTSVENFESLVIRAKSEWEKAWKWTPTRQQSAANWTKWTVTKPTIRGSAG